MQTRRRLPPAGRENEHGIAAIEFALVLPMLLVILFGLVEFGRYAIINQKLDKLVDSMADFTTQGTTISTRDLANFSDVATQILTPYGFSGTIIFSSIVNSAASPAPCSGNSSPCIIWQTACLGTASSALGVSGNTASNFPLVGMGTGQNVIVTEVKYNFAPMLSFTGRTISGLNNQTLSKIAVYKPRQGSLLTVTNNGGGCTPR